MCIVLIFTLQCSGAPNIQMELGSGIEETDTYYEITGLGAAAHDGSISEAEAKRIADEIAYFQAVEILAEMVEGIAVEGEMTLRDLNLREGKLTQIIKTNLKGITRIGTTLYEIQEDGSWLAAVTIRWEKINADGLASVIRNSQFPESNKTYSGIILDLRNVFGYNSLLSPRVNAYDGANLFSVRDVDPDVLFSNFGIPVFSTIQEAVALGKVGKNPLKLVPRDYDVSSGALILSKKDTKKMTDSPVSHSLVKQGKIALIM